MVVPSTLTEVEVAKVVMGVMNKFHKQPEQVPTSKAFLNKQVQQAVVKTVSEQLTDKQQSLLQDEEQVALDEIVAKTAELVVQHTIDISRVVVLSTGEVSDGYKP